jgi:hypothetical protein
MRGRLRRAELEKSAETTWTAVPKTSVDGGKSKPGWVKTRGIDRDRTDSSSAGCLRERRTEKHASKRLVDSKTVPSSTSRRAVLYTCALPVS